MKRLFAIGCSHTRYFWPTWADILGRSFDDYENWGHSGVGNKAILERTMEMIVTSKPTAEDLVVIQWSNPYRFDVHKIDPTLPTKWAMAGNISKWPKELSEIVFCDFSFVYHTCNAILLCKNLLENNKLNFVFFCMNNLGEDLDRHPALSIYESALSDITWMPAMYDWFVNSDLPKKSFYMLQKNKLGTVVDEHLTPMAHMQFLKQYWPKKFACELDEIWAQKAEDILNDVTHYDLMAAAFKQKLDWSENSKVIKGL